MRAILIQEVTKDPNTIAKEQQVSLASVKVQQSMHGSVPQRKPLLTKQDTNARLTFAKNM